MRHLNTSGIPSSTIAALPRYIQILRDPDSSKDEIAAASEILYGMAWWCDGGDEEQVSFPPENNMSDSQNLCFPEGWNVPASQRQPWVR